MLAATAACSTHERQLELIPSRVGDPSDERERLARMQMVRIVDATDPANPQDEQWEPASIAAWLDTYQCLDEANNNLIPSGPHHVIGFDYVDRKLCVAQRLLDMASDRATPVRLFDEDDPTTVLLVPAQSAATNAALADAAMRFHAIAALRFSLCMARQAVGLSALPPESRGVDCHSPTSQEDYEEALKARINPDGSYDDSGTIVRGSISLGARLGERIAQGYYLFREAAERASQLNLAVADAQRGNPSVSEQVSRGLAGPALSRAAAAHVLVGGTPGLLGSTNDDPRPGLCSVAELTPQASKALAILRDAGISPEAVLSTNVAIDRLVDGRPGDNVPDGSVAQRFAERWGFDFAEPPSGIDPRDSVADYFHLRMEDFEAARRYLANELTAFSRSRDAQLENPPVVGGTYKRFAGTATPPAQLAPEYMAAVAGYYEITPVSPPDHFMPEVWLPGDSEPTSMTNLAQGIDAALTHAGEVLAEQDAIVDDELRADLMTPLAALLAPRERLGRVQLCRAITGPTTETFEVSVAGFDSAAGLAVVRGEDGLRCAVDGSIEGSPCAGSFVTTPLVSALHLAELDDPGFEIAGFDSSAAGSFVLQQRLDGERLYVVQRIGTSNTPGSYKPLVGVHLDVGNQDYCFSVPIVPDAIAQAASIMDPNPEWCTTSRISCANTQFDTRLPLEDELAGDADGVESSWRHYLQLARQAATRADELGQDYLSSGIEFESKLESIELRDEQREQLAQDKAIASIVELQDTCGTAIDPVRLLKLLSNGSDQGDLKLIRDDAGPPCETGSQEILGQCIIDLETLADRFLYDPIHSDLVRLNACLSGDSEKPFVHLGSASRPVCLWQETNDSRTFCRGADAAHPCPILSRGGSCSNLNLPMGAKTPVTVTDTLKFINTEELPTFHKDGSNGELNVCDQIRALRSAPKDDYFNSIVHSNRFAIEKVKEFVKTIGFEARYGGYAAISLSGGVQYSTGSPWSGPQTAQWPCAEATDVRGCMNEESGLFCKSYDCSLPDQRARANDRMARAVVAIAGSVAPAWAKGVLHKFIWPRYLHSYVDGDNLHNTHVSGPTVRDFVLADGTTTTLTEYSSLKFDGIDDLDVPRSYASTTVPGANIGYSFFRRATDMTPVNLLNDGSLPMLGFHDTHGDNGLGPANLSMSRLERNYHFDSAAQYFYGGLSNDGVTTSEEDYYDWGYFNDKLRHLNTGLGPKVAASEPGTELRNNQYIQFYFNYEEQAMLDGLELLCQLQEDGDGCGVPPPVSSVADLPATRKFLECTADQIRYAGAHTVFNNFPEAALDPLNRELTSDAQEAGGGGVGVDIHLLRGALTDFAEVPALISDQLRQLSVAINDVYLTVQNSGITKDLADIQLQSEIGNQIAACVSQATPNVGAQVNPQTLIRQGHVGVSWNPGSIATCANSIAQIYFATEINSLVRQQADLAVDFKLNDFDGRFSTIATTMGSYATRLSKATSDVNAQLLKVEQQRNRAKLLLAKALYNQSFTSKFQARINALQNARFQTARLRYERARTTAQRMAFLAKRAIEMRLGIRLAELSDDLPLVEAPATWESRVCTLSGIDYQALASGGDVRDTSVSGSAQDVPNFAEEFIGDYVDRLENVVESYRLVHNFHEGTDLAILSLRDDVRNTRATCEVTVHNQLFNAGQLYVRAGAAPGWDRVGCATDEVGGEEVELPGCIGLLEGPEEAPAFGIPELSDVSSYTLQFGDKNGCEPEECGYRAGAYLGQELDVTPGIYRASVYVKDRHDFSDVGLQVALDGELVTGASVQTEEATFAWPRVHFIFEVRDIHRLSFRFTRPKLTTVGNPAADEITLAAPMLERLPFPPAQSGLAPAAFVNTSTSRTRQLAVCEDTRGDAFRATAWNRGVAHLCENGFSGDCDGSTATPYGYWETTFDLNQRDIETGTTLGNSGFARGNFNYRIETVGVNFAGTGVKDCSSVPLPSTCHSAGYVPYTLIHNGPYYVRNHLGRDFQAQLFTGRIENARGLATERYLTSPLSSADRELLTDFTRFELQGRPLNGNFVLRVWDSPGTNFNAIEDVQIVLKYRYWTRFN